MKKRIVIFGSTGGTGQELVAQALKANYSVTAFARSPEKLTVSDPRLNVFKGDVLNLEDVCRAVENQDVVLSCIGMPPSDTSMLRTKGTANIIKAMEKQGLDRLICQSTLGCGESRVALSWFLRYLIVPLILKKAFKDHEHQESTIENSTLGWTIVKPGSLISGKQIGRYNHGFAYSEKVKGKISRADTAHFMLSQIETNQYLRQNVALSY